MNVSIQTDAKKDGFGPRTVGVVFECKTKQEFKNIVAMMKAYRGTLQDTTEIDLKIQEMMDRGRLLGVEDV